MGLFSKKQKNNAQLPELPELPKLPELPELPGKTKENSSLDQLPKLPSLPQNSFGEKFSQNTIKDAIKGNNFEENDNFEEDENEIEEIGIKNQRHAQQIPREINRHLNRVRKAEPVFIRLDKFEESMKILEKTKNEIQEVEEMLRDTKKIKEEEEKELEYWGNNIKNIKKEIEKIEIEIFSKID